MPRLTSRWALTAILFPATVFLIAALPTRSETARVSGKFTMHYSQHHALPTGDAAAPVLLANQAEGTNTNTGPTEYMDGAKVTSVEIADLTQGNGTHQGYITFIKNGETSVSRWSGRVHTSLGQDQQPVTTFEGSWSKTGGTGAYEGGGGAGRYKGHAVSPTEYVVEWEGSLDLKARTAAR
jgi:hypothetical protein